MRYGGTATTVSHIRRQNEAEAEAARKAECTKEIDVAFTAINKNQEEYDKQLLTLSSGYLAISLAFIKDVVPMNQAVDRGLLYSSFIVLTVCIFSVLVSYQLSNEGQFKAKDFWEHEKEKATDRSGFPYRFATAVRALNIANGFVFLLGIVLSMSFVITNMHREAQLIDKQSSQREGLNLKVPAEGDWVQKGAHIKAPPQSPPPPPTPAPATDTKK